MIIKNGMNKLDIVYTYVNNNDKKWLNKYKKYVDNSLNYSRFNFHGEIFFSLLSVEKFFNWVNNIYIVHDNQEFDTSFLNIDFRKKIKFINHSDIIPNKYLPTFNSNVIECFIWRIQDLTDFFIYLNDDMFFGNYVYYSDFFTNNNQFKVFFKNIKKLNKNILYKQKYLIGRYHSENLFNQYFKTNYHIGSIHITFNLNKYLCKYVFFKFFKYLQKTLLLKIRVYDDPLNKLNNVQTFSFLQLATLMLIHTNIGILYHHVNKLIIQELNKNNLLELYKKKPLLYNINQLYDNQMDLWNKLQNDYFKLFNNNNYNHLLNKLEKEIS